MAPVRLTVKNAGNTVGTKKYTVKLSNPVPAEGFEVDWMAVCEASETHQLRFVLIRPAEAGGSAFPALPHAMLVWHLRGTVHAVPPGAPPLPPA